MSWEPKQKQYPHFDAPLSKREMRRLATSPILVERHAFFPFLRFAEEWQPFRRKKGRILPKPDKKSRTIRYASRRDTAVFAYYRFLLSQRYEAKLSAANLGRNVLAYRRILDENSRGKSNINFARETFEEISKHNSCIVVALDISAFFESIDHDILHSTWCNLLDVEILPPDHKHVFRNITRYADVPRDEAYIRLDLAKWRSIGAGQQLKITTRPLPVQLCTPSEFRKKISGKDPTLPSIIERNDKEYGIPQGAPLSDLLANAYLLDFDLKIKAYATSLGGSYFRYSDDIIVIIPTNDKSIASTTESYAISLISNYGSNLKIKPSKTSSYLYYKHGETLSFTHLKGKGINGLEYLGFRFDGAHAHVRASTLSRLHRNIVLGARAAAYSHVSRYTGKSLTELHAMFDIGGFMQNYGRVEDFDKTNNPKDWTFWTYAKRSESILGKMGSPIPKQLSRYRKFVVKTVALEIDKAFASRP